MKLSFRIPLSLSVAGALALATSAALAADTPEGLRKIDHATKGSTDVAKSGFEAPVAKVELAEKRETELTISAGALISTGNAVARSFTGAGDFRARRDQNQYTLTLAGNFGQARLAADTPVETTVENLQGKARYDRFISGNLAAFVALQGRRDRFQGLDLRLNFDPGLAYYIMDTEKRRLWVEGGYDLQYDLRRAETLQAAREAAEPQILSKTETRHNARLFAGYSNSVNALVSFSTGLEYLQGFKDTSQWRLNWDAALTSQISQSFSISTTFVLRYDAAPLPGIEKTDTITAINLVYRAL